MSPEIRSAAFGLAPIGRPADPVRDADRDRAHAAGYAAGYAGGAREAARAANAEAVRGQEHRAAAEERRSVEHAAAVAALARATQAAAARTAPVLADAERALHAAAFELATVVLGCELADGEHSARAALARVLDDPQVPGIQTVRLSLRDLDALRAAGGVPDIAGLELVADPTLAPGDAIGRHPDGYLDARITTALDRARTVLLGTDGAPSGLPHQHGPRS
ncbi:MAG: FliH/SctL family protein [Cellulomonas sp.]